eukprot:CAMPEP_0206004552 /NCGR_PEP_ID=MMETSP1464-20131121/4050_1 /ASSEMBLY_ACC=CAM_ASM_001124 /TAXON_ID=119497 /ORGANISM="Exanthemachrysis gayraliae, Strain RCC1523" /LENGTH=64 /DNA_ID=CAMNT_0053377967 /DNA_START=50 /DNA_END=240 /DNA_ORIENTATION=+
MAQPVAALHRGQTVRAPTGGPGPRQGRGRQPPACSAPGPGPPVPGPIHGPPLVHVSGNNDTCMR